MFSWLKTTAIKATPDPLMRMWGRHLTKGFRSPNFRVLKGRHLIIEAIQFDSSPVIGEIGVFKCEFARFLQNAYRPRELHLFDLFREIDQVGSGDVNGNHFELCSGDLLFENAVRIFGNDPNVTLHEGDSKCELEKFQDDFFDLIYIDGDHSYEGCLSDLEVSYKKVKNKGWIAGHDFAVNLQKCDSSWQFGVRQAVVDFCEHYNLKVGALFLDGCVGYAIQVIKFVDRQSNC